MKLALQNGRRSTKPELDGLRDRIVRIALASHPLSVRNLFYQLLSDDGSGATVEKSEAAYQKVCRLKGQLCRGTGLTQQLRPIDRRHLDLGHRVRIY